MRFCGIDLAANPRFTGLAMLKADANGLQLETLTVGVTDEQIIGAVQKAHRTGVDVPVGWPQPFVEFLAAQAQHRLKAPENTDASWRKDLAMRATDVEVQRRTGLTPLSVSANLIAYPAFRWAGIEARLRDLGLDVSRDGSGLIAEVYPAAALYRWGMPHRQYKGSRNHTVREQLVESLSQRFAQLEWNTFRTLAVADDNALDAIIAALIAQQIQTGNCEGPGEQYRDRAAVEGWIWMPAADSDGAQSTSR